MARLRINQGLNLTLDASTTDFIVKSLSGTNNGILLLNGRNWGMEVRIDEDSSGGDTFRVTKGSNGSTTLLTVENSGNLNIGGFELKLGTSDQSTRGNTGSSRVLVKDSNATLVVNYAGDFSGGVRVDGPGMTVTGRLNVNGTITPGISSGFAGHINSSEPIKFSNGSATQEIYVRKIRASASWATNDANDPGDGGGFFSGNLIVNGTITGNLNGNASTATKLQTTRSISLGGSLSGSTSFDGNADVTINASINSGAVGTTQLADNAVTTQKIADGAVTASKLAPGAATRMFQTTIGDGTNSTYTVTHNLNTTNVEVSLILLSTNEKIGAKVVVLNSNQIQVSFISPISTNSVKVVVIG
jgi:hypothetical protein